MRRLLVAGLLCLCLGLLGQGTWWGPTIWRPLDDETEPPLCTVAQLAVGDCATTSLGARVRVSDSNAATGDANCAVGTGPNLILCEYDGSNWTSIDLLYGATSLSSDSDLTVIEALANLAGVAGTLEGVDIDAAILACGTDRCQINLQVGTYTDVCVNIQNRDQGTRILGKGAATILMPYADQDSCTAITSQGQMIGINGSDNVELGHFVIDGDKQSVSFTNTTCAADAGLCGQAIRVNSPGLAISKNFYVHDLEIKDTIKQAIYLQHVDGAVIERNNIHDIGCHHTPGAPADDGDNTCGCSIGVGCGGWDAAADIGTGVRAKGTCIVAGVRSQHVTIRDNLADDCMYTGIEVFDTYAHVDGKSYEIVGNEVSGTPSGIVVNGGRKVHIHDNYVHDNAITGGAGDSGAGILLATNSAAEVVIERNRIVDNDSSGIIAKPTTGRGLTVRNNQIDNNCLDHAGGASLQISSSGTVFQDLLVESNIITGSSLCTRAIDSAVIEGDVRFLGGSNDDDVTLEHVNMVVSGLDVTGTLTFGATSSGLALDNDAGTTTYTAGNQIVRIDSGVITGQTINLDDSAYADSTPEVILHNITTADDNGGVQIAVESGAAGALPMFTVNTVAGTTQAYMGSASPIGTVPTNAVVYSESGIMNRIGTGSIRQAENRCVYLSASEITCSVTDGCAAATIEGTGHSFPVAVFATGADDTGAFHFGVPLGWSGFTLQVDIDWLSNDAACNNEADDDVCWLIDSGSPGDETAYVAPTLGGTAKSVIDTCHANGELMQSILSNYVHGMVNERSGILTVTRDVDGVCAGATDDDYPQDVKIIGVRLCAE